MGVIVILQVYFSNSFYEYISWALHEIVLRWVLQNLTDDKSKLVQVIMAWCHQARSYYLSQCWPRSMPPYGITRPQWSNLFVSKPSDKILFTHDDVMTWKHFPHYWPILRGERERDIKFIGLFENRGHRGPYSPYKPFNHNLYIGIIIFPHIDNPQSTGYN